MKKCIYTLNINRDYPQEITSLTYPLFKQYAHKIEADFYEITERKFPDFPITYEKCQIYELGKEHKNDWNIFLDCDTLVHPDCPDWTDYLRKDTVAHHAHDLANVRWKYDGVFWRDGRNIGSATWCCFASDWCLDLFKPLDDITLEDAIARIFPLKIERDIGMIPQKLIEDYVFSRNIARYGLKFTTLRILYPILGLQEGALLWHMYLVSSLEEKKVLLERQLKEVWRIL